MFQHPTTRLLALLHGSYCLLGGLWPLVHMSSFIAVTGPKADLWLVRTVAGLLLVLSGALFWSRWRREHGLGTVIVASGTALILGLTAIISSLSHRIAMVYMVDGLLHLLFFLSWTFAVVVYRGGLRGRNQPTHDMEIDIPERHLRPYGERSNGKSTVHLVRDHHAHRRIKAKKDR